VRSVAPALRLDSSGRRTLVSITGSIAHTRWLVHALQSPRLHRLLLPHVNECYGDPIEFSWMSFFGLLARSRGVLGLLQATCQGDT